MLENFSGFDDTNRFFKIIRRTIKKTLKEEKITKIQTAIVTSVSGLNITAYLIGDEPTNTSVYQNRTGQTISVGNVVYIVMPNGDLTNAFIGWKR